jgi:hypothetical protein
MAYTSRLGETPAAIGSATNSADDDPDCVPDAA